jgi:hypothetical protein
VGNLLLDGIAGTLNGVGRALVYTYDVYVYGVKKVCNMAKKTPSTMGKVKERYLCRVCRGSHRMCNSKCNMAKKTAGTIGKVKERYLCNVCGGSHRVCCRECNIASCWVPYPHRIDKKAKKVGIRGELLATEMRRNDHELFSYAANMREELPYNRERQVKQRPQSPLVNASLVLLSRQQLQRP